MLELQWARGYDALNKTETLMRKGKDAGVVGDGASLASAAALVRGRTACVS